MDLWIFQFKGFVSVARKPHEELSILSDVNLNELKFTEIFTYLVSSKLNYVV